jgi:hypothetical protein
MEETVLLASQNLGNLHKLFDDSRHMKVKQESINHSPA